MPLENGKPAVLLAPMEGVTDAPTRAVLTKFPGYTLCVTEFIRVAHEIPPQKVFLRHVPELKNGGKTTSGVPVAVQILGGDAEKMAEAALRAVVSGAFHIDVNFGCPAPTVNRHDGGATLLKYPKRIRLILETIRKSIPKEVTLSAKLRLGWDSACAIHENSEMAAQAGIDWITIHGRTKTAGYGPPLLWEPIGEVKRRLKIPVVANGDIWSMEDYLRCREVTGCEHWMLGRGALANPFLASQIMDREGTALVGKPDWKELFLDFAKESEGFYDNPGYVVRRVKQWLNLAGKVQAIPWFQEVKTLTTFDEVMQRISATS